MPRDAYFNSSSPVGAINLNQIGYSDSAYETASLEEIDNPPPLTGSVSFISAMGGVRFLRAAKQKEIMKV